MWGKETNPLREVRNISRRGQRSVAASRVRGQGERKKEKRAEEEETLIRRRRKRKRLMKKKRLDRDSNL